MEPPVIDFSFFLILPSNHIYDYAAANTPTPQTPSPSKEKDEEES